LDNKDFIPPLEERGGRTALTSSLGHQRGQEDDDTQDSLHNSRELHTATEYQPFSNGGAIGETPTRNGVANGASAVAGKGKEMDEEEDKNLQQEGRRKCPLPLRRNTLYAHELELMKGKKGLRGMLHELVHTKNREVLVFIHPHHHHLQFLDLLSY
jgi:hypothetical protein